MSLAKRLIIFGILVQLVGASWLYLAFRSNVVVAMDLRRELQYVEFNLVQCAKADRSALREDIWSRALIFEADDVKLRGVQQNEEFIGVLKRIMKSMLLPYWPGWILIAIGIALCFQTEKRNKNGRTDRSS